MKCREWNNQITHYLADEMPANKRAEFESHLNDCPNCRNEMELFREVDLLIDAAGIDVPDVDLTGRIMKQVMLSEEEEGANEPVKESAKESVKESAVPADKELKKTRGKRTVAILQDLVTAAAAAIILFWFSGSAMFGSNAPIYTEEVVRVSNTVGGAFQSYVNFSAKTVDKLSGSIQQINSGQMKGDE